MRRVITRRRAWRVNRRRLPQRGAHGNERSLKDGSQWQRIQMAFFQGLYGAPEALSCCST
jgi:hypothetical protein